MLFYNASTQRETKFAAILFILASLIMPVQAQWANNQAAVNVIGQPNFTSNTPNSGGISASTLNAPTGVAVDPTTGKVFIADYGNRRVLRYSSVAAMMNGQAAEAVLGQPDFFSATDITTRSGMSDVWSIFVDEEGRLWVADYSNRRVLRFDNAATKPNGADADGVLGQPDFGSNTAATTQSGMVTPICVFVDSSKRLWVADYNNNRVLRFDNAAAKPNGANADGVLGEMDFTSNAGGTSQNRLNGPQGIYVDKTGRLWVVEFQGNRVLRFDNAAAKPNGGSADGVLGAPNFTSGFAGFSAELMDGPTGVTGDPSGRLYVSDRTNNRVLIFNDAATKANGAQVDNVLGQPGFASNNANNGSGATALHFPHFLFFDNVTYSLYVPDQLNHRVKRYTIPIPPPPRNALNLSVQAGGRPNNAGANIGDPAICLDPAGLVGIEVMLTNTGNAAAASSFTATLPAGITAIVGTCNAASINPGTCTIAANGGSVTWNGQLNAGETVNIVYRTRISANAAQGTQFCIDNVGTVGGVPANLQYCFTLSCPLTNTRVSDQKPGSVLVFPYYTSSIGGSSDTRLTISNVSNAASTLANQTYVHLFFIEGTSCQQSDLFLCLTPNASFSFKASEYDPGNTGYLLAVVVNAQGMPIQNNVLIGNAFVTTPTLADNYSAESFAANSFAVATVSGNTATLYFDHTGYDAVPKQFAVEIQSPLEATGQQVVTAGLSGDLTTGQVSGAAQVGTGLAFNEKEVFSSFSAWLTGACQARATIATNSPRVPNGLGNLIKAGQAGSLKFNVGAAVGLLLTPRTAAWRGIRALHKTQTVATTLTIPVFVAVC